MLNPERLAVNLDLKHIEKPKSKEYGQIYLVEDALLC